MQFRNKGVVPIMHALYSTDDQQSLSGSFNDANGQYTNNPTFERPSVGGRHVAILLGRVPVGRSGHLDADGCRRECDAEDEEPERDG